MELIPEQYRQFTEERQYDYLYDMYIDEFEDYDEEGDNLITVGMTAVEITSDMDLEDVKNAISEAVRDYIEMRLKNG